MLHPYVDTRFGTMFGRWETIRSTVPAVLNVGKILNKPNPIDRLPGSLAAEVVAIINGADIIRTHNVKESKRLVTIAQSLRSNKSL